MTLRIFIAVTHLLGAGHLTRAAAIGRAFAAAGHEVTLASGGMPARLIATAGMHFVQVPPVRARDEDFRSLCDADGAEIGPAYRAARQAALLAAFAAARPDVLITELYPFGRRILAAEFDALLAAAAQAEPKPLLACSLRDILVAPLKPGRAEAAHRIVAQSYDVVLVHGDPALVPLDASWPLDDATRSRLRYTGYVDADAPLVRRAELADDAPVLVSGGSSEAAMPLYRAVLGAAVLVPERRWHVLVGGSVAPDAFANLQAAAPANMVVERARADFRRLLADAAAFVGLAGYNTIVDLLATRTRSVLVPFERGRETEQRLRAERLAENGLAVLLPESSLSPAALAGCVRDVLASPRPAANAIDSMGAARTVALIERYVGDRTRHGTDMTSRHVPPVAAPALSHPRLTPSIQTMIRETLDRLADTGTTLPIWWRDDDAVRHTPALDRLLGLADRIGMPIAVAAIPAMSEASLAARLSEVGNATILVHGLSHANHAPDGAKPAEFGAHRPLAAMAGDAGAAQAQIEALFGARARPVFVPPWNRIAPELVSALPGLGFAGLSTFGRREAARTSVGLALVNTHLDPVDWRGGRGLVGEEAFASMWRRATASRGELAASAADTEPLGLLTHHLVMGDPVWGFCEALMELLLGHRAVLRLDLATLGLNSSSFQGLTKLSPGGIDR